MVNAVELTVSNIVDTIHRRRNNKQDSRIVFTGNTGKAKSTLVAKILFRFKDEGFDPWKHQVYNRKDAIDLIMQERTFCWDDEAIDTLYNRGFHSPEQQDYIKKIIKNRDHFNVIMTVLPRFEYLDKHVKPLYFMHIMMIHRPELKKDGTKVDPNDKAIGLVFMPKEYGKDPWRIDITEKIMKTWDEYAMRNPKFKPPYHKLPTFAGILRFNDITKEQREIVDLVKKTKKHATNEDDAESTKLSFIEKLYKQLINGQLTSDALEHQIQYYNIDQDDKHKKKLSSVKVTLNNMLRDNGEKNTLKYYLSLSEQEDKQESQNQVMELLDG